MPSIQLATAKLCSNCQRISEAKGETCPACGAVANWLLLSAVLGLVPPQPVELEAR